MAVALYARVSTTRQAENELSIPDQLRQMHAWCVAQGLTVAKEYIEPGASATDDKRPVFQKMIAEATQSPLLFETVVVHSRSRFFRDLLLSLTYEHKLKSAGVRLQSITQPTTDDSNGELISNVISMFDAYSSKETAKHTLRSMKENARQGYWNGSRPTYGYRAIEVGAMGNRGRRKRKLEIDPPEAEIVRELYDLYLRGHGGKLMGMKAITTHLNQRGITMRGRPWRMQKVHEILSDTTYIGISYFNQRDAKHRTTKPESEWIVCEVPAIIEDHLFERVKERRERSSPKARAPRAMSSTAPLMGLLKCGHCGAGMAQASGKSGTYRYYKCTTRLNKNVRGCDSRSLPRIKADEMVLSTLAEKVFTPQRVRLMLQEFERRRRASVSVEDKRLISLQRELDQAKIAQTRLFEAVEKGALPIDDALRMRAQKLQARKSEIQIEMAELKDRQQLGAIKANMPKIETFCAALKQRMRNPDTGLAKAYLNLVVDEIRLQGNELRIRGSYSRLASAIDLGSGMKPGEVPSFIPDWCGWQELNPRPLGS